MTNWNDRISPIVKSVPPSGIRKFFDIASEMEDVISLGVGEPDFDTPENICRYEAEDPAVLIAEAEALDDTYYSAFPSVRALAEEYGNISNTRWYNLRDMKWHWRQRYLKQYPLELYDVCDERQTGSRRY